MPWAINRHTACSSHLRLAWMGDRPDGASYLLMLTLERESIEAGGSAGVSPRVTLGLVT